MACVVACVVVLGNTPALVVGLLIALSGEAINQLPIASVYGHKFFEYGSVRKCGGYKCEKRYRITGLCGISAGLVRMLCLTWWLGAVHVHVVCVIQLSRSS